MARKARPVVKKYEIIRIGASIPTDSPSLYANSPISTSGFAISEYK